MSKPVRIAVSLTFETPPAVGAGGSRGSIVDRPIERNARGQPIIPGSHVKGKLRRVCEQILRTAGAPVCEAPRPEDMCPNRADVRAPCPVCRIFGSPAYPSPVCFHDLMLEPGDGTKHEACSIRVATAISRRRRTAAEKRVFVVETAPYVPLARFTNEEAISGALENTAQVKLLMLGLMLLPYWGGMSSRGVGWLARREEDGRERLHVDVSASFDGTMVAPADWEEVRTLWSA